MPTEDRPDDPGVALLLQRTARELGLDLRRLTAVRRLVSGRSGSHVLDLRSDGDRLVLKVTEEPARLARAALELAVLADPGSPLRPFLPGFRGGRATADAVHLLLQWHPPLPPAAALDPDGWEEVAASLGRLHATALPPGLPLRPARPPTPTAVHQAVVGWGRHGFGAVAERASARLGPAGGRSADPDLVVTHGDSHLENLVRGPDGGLRWLDWQEAYLGDGLQDLVFCWQRAEFTGARLPRDAMVAAYARSRGLRDDPALRRALEAAELGLLLVAWPGFLGYGTEAARRGMGERLAQLAGAEGS